MVRAQHISLASVSLRLVLTVTVRGRGETEQPCQPFTPGHAAHGSQPIRARLPPADQWEGAAVAAAECRGGGTATQPPPLRPAKSPA